MASTGLVVNGADAVITVRGVDAVSLLLAVAGVVTTWGLLAGRTDGYVGALVVTWAGVVHTVLSHTSDPHGDWFWDAMLAVLVIAGLYLFVRHERFLPSDEASA